MGSVGKMSPFTCTVYRSCFSLRNFCVVYNIATRICKLKINQRASKKAKEVYDTHTQWHYLKQYTVLHTYIHTCADYRKERSGPQFPKIASIRIPDTFKKANGRCFTRIRELHCTHGTQTQMLVVWKRVVSFGNVGLNRMVHNYLCYLISS